jgi:hypothetical protein
MLVKLRAVEATPDSAPFGQSIAASPDGDQVGPHDAHLDLSRGIPRLGHGHLLDSAGISTSNHPQLLLPGLDRRL